jgi:ribosomal-protein-alanine N-acetyltransferase
MPLTFSRETKRLLIRPYTENDLDDCVAMFTDPDVVRYIPESPLTAESAAKRLRAVLDRYESPDPGLATHCSLAVVQKDGGRVIGWVGLGPLTFPPHEIELYYGFNSGFWGKGYATEAARSLLEYAFDHFRLSRVVGITKPENTASQRVLEKIGMTLTDTLRDLPPGHEFFEGCLYFAINRADYARLKNDRFSIPI